MEWLNREYENGNQSKILGLAAGAGMVTSYVLTGRGNGSSEKGFFRRVAGTGVKLAGLTAIALATQRSEGLGDVNEPPTPSESQRRPNLGAEQFDWTAEQKPEETDDAAGPWPDAFDDEDGPAPATEPAGELPNGAEETEGADGADGPTEEEDWPDVFDDPPEVTETLTLTNLLSNPNNFYKWLEVTAFQARDLNFEVMHRGPGRRWFGRNNAQTERRRKLSWLVSGVATGLAALGDNSGIPAPEGFETNVDWVAKKLPIFDKSIPALVDNLFKTGFDKR